MFITFDVLFRCDGEKRGDGNHNTTMFSTIGEDKESCEGEASPTSAPPVSPTSATSSTSTSSTSTTKVSPTTTTTDSTTTSNSANGIVHQIIITTNYYITRVDL